MGQCKTKFRLSKFLYIRNFLWNPGIIKPSILVYQLTIVFRTTIEFPSFEFFFANTVVHGGFSVEKLATAN